MGKKTLQQQKCQKNGLTPALQHTEGKSLGQQQGKFDLNEPLHHDGRMLSVANNVVAAAMNWKDDNNVDDVPTDQQTMAKSTAIQMSTNTTILLLYYDYTTLDHPVCVSVKGESPEIVHTVIATVGC